LTITLTPVTPDEILAKYEGGFPPEVSPLWIEKLRLARGPDPWVLGFHVIDAASQAIVGSAAFKGEPDAAGVVEIAYGTDERFRGRGYATTAARALIDFAFADPRVRLICAHTMPGALASARVLEKCGFARVPDVVDPEDGPVWRFERRRGDGA
jgi:RimJ/RimL family protein N-acetyltransferase